MSKSILRPPLITVIWLATVAALAMPSAQDDRRLAAAAQPERRMALVIGNDTYAASPLRNARNDARAVGAALDELGFKVTRLEDASRIDFGNAVARFGDGLQAGDVAFFYFAGHGAEIDRENYLIPIDFGGESAAAVRLNAVRASEVKELLETRARVTLLVLDACRNNPFTGSRTGGGGLAPMEPRGSLIAFAAAAGQTAADNSVGGNGLFTIELLRVLREPGLTVQEVFSRVRQNVYQASAQQQLPAVYDGLLGSFVFRPAPAPNPPAASASAAELALRAELSLWEAVKDSKDPAAFEEYLRQYPEGKYRVPAQARLADLRRPASPPPANPVVPPSRPAESPAPRSGTAEPTATGAVPPATPSVGTKWSSPKDGRTMVWVPPGSFEMGSPVSEAGRDSDEGPQQAVRLPTGLWLDEQPVTHAAYQRFIQAESAWQKGRVTPAQATSDYLKDWTGVAYPPGKGEHPVIWVSWYAASAYCAWAGKRLPSEAEWEYAARAGTSTAYWWGDQFDAARANAGGKGMEAVGNAQRINPWGLAEMSGNVWNWTASLYKPYPFSDDGRNALNAAGPRVVRGGAWMPEPLDLRSANRNRLDPSNTSQYVGFRCAR